MFTGIVQQLGEVSRISKKGGALQLAIKIVPPAKQVNRGDSIAVNGVCLTVTSLKGIPLGPQVSFDVMPETVRRSTLGELKAKSKVNIEPAILSGEPFGGHFVQGHVDATGTVSNIKKQGDEYIMQISCPVEITGQMIEKGSVALDGVSLTVVNVSAGGGSAFGGQSGKFSVALIPFTLSHTNLGKKKSGDKVNIEVDMMGKWVRKLLGTPSIPRSLSKSGTDEGF